MRTIVLLFLIFCCRCWGNDLTDGFAGWGAKVSKITSTPDVVWKLEKDGRIRLSKTFPKDHKGVKRYSVYFWFAQSMNWEKKTMAFDVKTPAALRMLRIQFGNHGEKTPAESYSIDRKFFGQAQWKTVYTCAGKAAGAVLEPTLSTQKPPSNIKRFVIHLIAPEDHPDDEIVLEIKNFRILDQIPASAIPARKSEAAPEVPFPKDFSVYVPRRSIELTDAAIVAAPAQRSLADQVQAAFQKHWNLTLPILSPQEALQGTQKSWILPGPSQGNDLTTRLYQSHLLDWEPTGYELRVLPQALNWKRDILYLGGIDDRSIQQGITRFFEKFPRDEKIPFFLETAKSAAFRMTASETDRAVEALKAHYRSDDGQKNYFAITNFLLPAAVRYRATGNAEAGRALLESVRVFNDYYLNQDQNLQQFMAYRLFQTFDLLEEFELCTENDWRNMAEVVRKITFSCRNHAWVLYTWDAFERNTPVYVKNSGTFISRSLGTGAHWLLNRYDYAPAREWVRFAEFAFKGVAPHPFSPEDATGYQYMSYENFMDYAMATGLVTRDFFRNPEFLRHLEYIKLQYNHMGWMPGYGDAFALYHTSGVESLKIAAELLGDQDAAWILARRYPNGFPDPQKLPLPGKKTLGLHVAVIGDFKKEQNFPGMQNRFPLLDKASFRSGWTAQSDYLAVTGMNRGFHGHFDGGSIAQYMAGDRLWIFEGDYIERFPMHHNMLSVSRDGLASLHQHDAIASSENAVAPDAAAQVTGAVQTEDRRSAALGMLTEQLNGTNWMRWIGYEADSGFWVIDRVQALQQGTFALDLRFRTIGEMMPGGAAVTVQQPPSDHPDSQNRFFLVSGDDSERRLSYRFERGHAQKDGNIARYAYLEKNADTSIIHRRKVVSLKPAEEVFFVHFLRAGNSAETAPEVRKLSDSAWIAETSGKLRLALVKSFRDHGVDFEGDAFFAGPQGAVGIGVKKLNILGKNAAIGNDGNVVLNAEEFPLEAFRGKGIPVLPGKKMAEKNIPDLSPALQFPAEITALHADSQTLGTGLQDGTFLLLDQAGKELWRAVLPAEISQIGSMRDASGRRIWFAGTGPTTDSQCFLYAFDDSGKQLWQKKFGVILRRDSRITVLKSFRPGTDRLPVLFAGTESWLGYALDPADGRELWRMELAHGYTDATSADLNGDGSEELVAGGPYLYQTIFRDGGITPGRLSRSPGCDAVATADLDGDGKPEALYGRHDGFVYAMKDLGRRLNELWVANVGGAVTGLLVLPEGRQLLAATRAGNLTLLDHTGKVLRHQYFPSALLELHQAGDKIYTVTEDGTCYRIIPETMTISPIGKSPAKDEFLQQIHMALSDDVAAFSAGKELYRLP